MEQQRYLKKKYVKVFSENTYEVKEETFDLSVEKQNTWSFGCYDRWLGVEKMVLL